MTKWKLPEANPMTNETFDAHETVFSDHAPEAVILALEDQVDAKDKRIAELEAKLAELEGPNQ